MVPTKKHRLIRRSSLVALTAGLCLLSSACGSKEGAKGSRSGGANSSDGETSDPSDPPTTGSGGAGDPTTDGSSSGGTTPSTGGQPSTGGGVDPTPPIDDVDFASRAAAEGVRLDEIHFNQAVGTELVEDNSWVAPNARRVPLITNRDTLFQVTWTLDDDYEPHEVEAILSLQSGGNAPVRYSARLVPNDSPDLGDFDGTFSFLIAGDQIQADTEFSVHLLELDGVEGSEPASAGRFPQESSLRALEPWPDLMPIRLMIIPLSTDCTNARTYDAPLRQQIEDYVRNTYPVNDLEIRYHDPEYVDDPRCDEPTSEDDGPVMDLLESLRASEGLGSEWYYQGQFTEDWPGDYGGYAWLLEDDGPNEDRVAWSADWIDTGEPVNIPHELGHNMGSEHTWNDDDYIPSAGAYDGERDTYGYAIVGDKHPQADGVMKGRILRPTIDAAGDTLDHGENNNFWDMMNYEQPYWVSAYSYAKWAERIRVSNTWSSMRREGGEVALLRVYLGADRRPTFKQRRGHAPEKGQPGSLSVDETSYPVTVKMVKGSEEGSTHYLEFAVPEELKLRHKEFSVRVNGQTFSHTHSARWF